MSPYRLWAGVVAVILAVVFVWTVVITFGPEETVVPESGFETADARTAQATPPSATDAPASPAVSSSVQDILRSRTELQRWRAEVGPSPENKNTAAAPDRDARIVEETQVPNPGELVQSWQQNPPHQILRPPAYVEGNSSLPYTEAQVFKQPQGRDWRRQHNDPVRYGGGWLMFGVALALALFLLFRGRIPLMHGFSGHTIQRFNSVERANHWMTASSFIVMGLTGLVILYGKPLLIPVMGESAFASLASWSAWLHMAFAVPFVLGILLMIVMWIVGNLPDRYDWPWLKRFGGFLRDSPDHPPAGRFNAGQKLVFWSVVLGGLALLGTGLSLMFPFYWFGYDGMQWSQLFHAALGLVMVAIILGHIYIGTVGMEGAFDAMWSGQVDRNWLKEHHSVWYRQIAGEDADAEPRARSGAARQQPAE